MERSSGRLIGQLQSVQIRQRNVIQQLQAENARRLCDLADVRQERDTFRKEVARVRKENAELQDRLEEVKMAYQDLKRERAALARSMLTLGHTHIRNVNPGYKIINTLSVLNEEQTVSSTEGALTSTKKKSRCPELEPWLHRALPDPPKSESPRPDNPAPPCNDLTVVTAGHSATL